MRLKSENGNLVTTAPDRLQSEVRASHDQARKPLCKLWGKIWSCLPPSLGPAVLPQQLQGRLPCESGEEVCGHERVVRLLGSQDDVESRECNVSNWRKLPTSAIANTLRTSPAWKRIRPLLATMSNSTVRPALLALSMLPLSSHLGFSDTTGPDALSVAAGSCGSDLRVGAAWSGYRPYPSSGGEIDCAAAARTPRGIAQARAFVVETASSGLYRDSTGGGSRDRTSASRIRRSAGERNSGGARDARPVRLRAPSRRIDRPHFGVGGFADKFHSLHTYGLAVDLHGIGRPGSPEARRFWHGIAAKNGVVCPYGPRSRAEVEPLPADEHQDHLRRESSG